MWNMNFKTYVINIKLNGLPNKYEIQDLPNKYEL